MGIAQGVSLLHPYLNWLEFIPIVCNAMVSQCTYGLGIFQNRVGPHFPLVCLSANDSERVHQPATPAT